MVPLPGGRLLIHTHRSLEDVLVLDTAGDCTLSKVPVSGVFPGALRTRVPLRAPLPPCHQVLAHLPHIVCVAALRNAAAPIPLTSPCAGCQPAMDQCPFS